MTEGNQTLIPGFQHFDAFGVRLTDLAAGASLYHWRGQEGSETAEYDAETHPAGSGRYGVSLVYMQTRDYDPETGRFLTPDALYISSLTTQGMNRYIYCNNDPVNYSDPTGKFPFLAIILALAFAAGMWTALTIFPPAGLLSSGFGLGPATTANGRRLACFLVAQGFSRVYAPILLRHRITEHICIPVYADA